MDRSAGPAGTVGGDPGPGITSGPEALACRGPGPGASTAKPEPNARNSNRRPAPRLQRPRGGRSGARWPPPAATPAPGWPQARPCPTAAGAHAGAARTGASHCRPGAPPAFATCARPRRRQARGQGVPGQEIAVRQQEQPPAALALGIEERQAFVQPVAVHAGIGLGPHRPHPAGQLAALAWTMHAQHRAQFGQLPWMRQWQHRHRHRHRHGRGHGHGYQLTARLAETARPGRV